MTYLLFSLFLGDRYWYENDIPPSSFTKDQLNEIRKSKLAQVICENIPSIDFVQPNAFLESDPFLNALMPCRGETILHTLNLNAWATGKIFAYFFFEIICTVVIRTLHPKFKYATKIEMASLKC